MKLDARNGDRGYFVFDVSRCVPVPEAVWIDSDTAEWGSYVRNGHKFVAPLVTITHKEKSISIYPDRKLVLFNEIPDEEALVAKLVNAAVLEAVS